MPNRLAASTSPYLQQHADNPVDWYEWGDDAFDRARAEDIPVLLSVGYAACHWCHVMAHESFEHVPTADYMNRHFVNVKVDREERPDVDRIYMEAVQATTGRGGWPMTVFLFPDGRPFYAGTYFPRDDHGHHPSFRRVMESVVAAWQGRRAELESHADQLTAAVRRTLPPAEPANLADAIERGVGAVLADADDVNGGFGGAPKFPQAPTLELLLRSVALRPEDELADRAGAVLDLTLDRMARGGIYDHVGGGFSRYSVDRRWLVPHFEKMLYDNALLARLYLRAWQVRGHALWRNVAVETLDYLITDLRDPSGGLHSSEDADSEGEEGRYYVWSAKEFRALAGPDADVLADLYGVTEAGNFEGSNVLSLPRPASAVAGAWGLAVEDLEARRARLDGELRSARRRRVRPDRDDKIVTAWNGLGLRALAEAAAVLEEPRYLVAAQELAAFAADGLFTPDGRLLRSTRDGRAGPAGFCDDYAALGLGLLAVYQVDGNQRWFDLADRLLSDMVHLFSDDSTGGGFFTTATDADPLIDRPKELQDNPTPSPNSLAAEALLTRDALTGGTAGAEAAASVRRAAGVLIDRFPAAVGHLLAVSASEPLRQVAIVGPEDHRRSLEREVWRRFRPDCVVAVGEEDAATVPLLSNRPAGTTATAYVCRGFVCDLPVSDPAGLGAQLDG